MIQFNFWITSGRGQLQKHRRRGVLEGRWIWWQAVQPVDKSIPGNQSFQLVSAMSVHGKNLHSLVSSFITSANQLILQKRFRYTPNLKNNIFFYSRIFVFRDHLLTIKVGPDAAPGVCCRWFGRVEFRTPNTPANIREWLTLASGEVRRLFRAWVTIDGTFSRLPTTLPPALFPCPHPDFHPINPVSSWPRGKGRREGVVCSMVPVTQACANPI